MPSIVPSVSAFSTMMTLRQKERPDDEETKLLATLLQHHGRRFTKYQCSNCGFLLKGHGAGGRKIGGHTGPVPGGSAMMTKITGAGCSLGGVTATIIYYWENRNTLSEVSNIPAYILTIIKNKSLDRKSVV